MSNNRCASHAFVIGGTGMLRQVSLTLAKRGYNVSVLARNPKRLSAMKEAAAGFSGKIETFSLDYRDGEALRKSLQDAVKQFGPIELVVAWIHGIAPQAPQIVGKYVSTRQNQTCRFFHVLGSASSDPSRSDNQRRAQFEGLDHLLYREVVLGFVKAKEYSRWLTHEEISAGVLEAIDQDQPRWIVGTVQPWSARP